jgi:alpha-L-rhamnosidase
MMRIGLIRFLLVILAAVHTLSAQDLPIHPRLLTNAWEAHWIAPNQACLKEYGVYHFRKTITLGSVPARFVVHVSADNRYRLFVNGKAVCYGPARGDLAHWRYETADIAPFLKPGPNLLAAVVWNFAGHAPWAQMSSQTAFILQGDGAAEAAANTDASWRVMRNPAYSPTGNERAPLGQFLVVGPGDCVDGLKYPWGWTESAFDDSGWETPRDLFNGQPESLHNADQPWRLVPRTIPFMQETPEIPLTVAKAAGLNPDPAFLTGKGAWTIPPRSRCIVLFDQAYNTTAYPELQASGGRGSEIVLIYSEAMYDSTVNRTGGKGNRNDIRGKEILGTYDRFLPDGGKDRLFRPLWFRTYRYLQAEIRTGDDPLVIQSLRGLRTGYPFEEKASFESSDPSLKSIWEVGWRTAKNCAGETYYDCPYYEQLQYVGDTRIQCLISLAVSGDDRLMRNAISLFDCSRIPEGLTQSRYPSSIPQIIPPFSLFWTVMVHDYWMYRDDPAFVRSMLTGIEAVLAWYESRLDSTGMLGPMPYWHFVDWPDPWNWDNTKNIGGVPDGGEIGHSSILSLQYVYALQRAAELFDVYHKSELAARYRILAASVRAVVTHRCWDVENEMLRDLPERPVFSQHANTLAVLTDLVSPAEQKNFITKIARDKSLIQCTLYFRFYLLRAMKKAGLGDDYVGMLEPWRDMLKLGLTTFAERPEPTRSDCHAWSSSPNFDLLSTVCGIEPASPGFKTVRIAPCLGPLTWVKAAMPHPIGSITVSLKRKGKTGVEGEVDLPHGLKGTFLWNGRETVLESGLTRIE